MVTVTLCNVLRSRLEAVGAEAGALVHRETGVCLEAIPDTTDLTTLPIAGDAFATLQLAYEIARITGIADDSVEEVLSATATKYELSYPLHASDGSDLLLYLRFDTRTVSTALARRRLAGFERQVELSPEDRTRFQALALPPVPVQTTQIPPEESGSAVTATAIAPPRPVSVPASPAENALRHRERALSEEKEYAHMNAESIRWLKEMKQRINWARPFSTRDEPVMN